MQNRGPQSALKWSAECTESTEHGVYGKMVRAHQSAALSAPKCSTPCSRVQAKKCHTVRVNKHMKPIILQHRRRVQGKVQSASNCSTEYVELQGSTGKVCSLQHCAHLSTAKSAPTGNAAKCEHDKAQGNQKGQQRQGVHEKMRSAPMNSNEGIDTEHRQRHAVYMKVHHWAAQAEFCMCLKSDERTNGQQ
eukprot:1141468-Pelagomonas_calceolata.AAC.1